jgi:hypothetical protein
MFLAKKLNRGAGTPIAKDAQFNYVTMLLHGNGTNGAQNNTFVDSGPNASSITRNGTATQGSFSPFGSNWSNNFINTGGVGTGAYLTAPSSSAMQLGSGNFTIECWVFLTKVAENAFIGRSPFDNTNNEWVFQTGTGNNLRFGYSANGLDSQTIFESTTTVPISTWTHVAAVRNSSTLTFYINGASAGTNSISATIYSGNTTTTIGSYAQSAYPTGYAVVNGYLSNIRVVKGTAVYTSNFTPSTTPLTAISGTSMLTCQSNRFLDNSSNNFTFTAVNGTPTVQRFSPFGVSDAYSTATISGSASFATSSTSGIANLSASLTGASSMTTWTIEMFTYNEAASWSDQVILGDWTPNLIRVSSTVLEVYLAGSQRFSISNGLPRGQWNHLAICCDSTDMRVYVNGVRIANNSSYANLSINLSTLILGSETTTSPINDRWNGYISNFRLLNGTALYTGTTCTVPTAPLTAIANTKVLLKMEGAAIVDNAMMNDLETMGSAQISTSVVKYGTGSINNNGATSFPNGTATKLRGRPNPNFSFGTGDFTVEGWFYQTTIGSTYQSILEINNHLGVGGILFIGNTSGVACVYAADTGGGGFVAQQATTANVWQHIAFVRNNGTLRTYVNGVSTSSQAGFTLNIQCTIGLTIGGERTGDGNYNYYGYMDDFRVTRYARYTANFTPPTAELPDIGPI